MNWSYRRMSCCCCSKSSSSSCHHSTRNCCCCSTNWNWTNSKSCSMSSSYRCPVRGRPHLVVFQQPIDHRICPLLVPPLWAHILPLCILGLDPPIYPPLGRTLHLGIALDRHEGLRVVAGDSS